MRTGDGEVHRQGDQHGHVRHGMGGRRSLPDCVVPVLDPNLGTVVQRDILMCTCYTLLLRETCVRRLPPAWGVTVCRSSLPYARECRLGEWFGFVGAALLPAVGTCVVLAFGAMPGQ